MKKIAASTLSTLTLFSFFMSVVGTAQAAISNPAAGLFGTGADAARSGTMTMALFVMMWNAIVIVGGLLVLYYFIMGSVEWITSEGDKGKLQKARDKMLHAFIGLLILVSSYTILDYLGVLVFQGVIDIFKPTIYTPN